MSIIRRILLLVSFAAISICARAGRPVNGTTAFKEQIAQAAAAAKLPVTFDDAVLERRRQELLQATMMKESRHEQSNPANQERFAGRGNGRSGSAIAGATEAAHDGRADIVVHGAGSACKPNIGRIGKPAARKPKPFAKPVRTRCGSHSQRN